MAPLFTHRGRRSRVGKPQAVIGQRGKQVPQAIHDSGTQKAHSDKNVVVVNTHPKRVSFLSTT
ncbi:MAG: hypothetical protein ACREU7_05735, partial [Burkholderiales bacterium]